MTTTTRGRARRGRPSAARPPGHASRADPARDDVEDLLATEVVEWFVISTRQHVQCALPRSLRVELLASSRVDELIGVSRQDEEWNRDAIRVGQHIVRGAVPLRVQPAGDLGMNKRVGAIGLYHLRD